MMANGKGPDQMLHSGVSDMDLHVCPGLSVLEFRVLCFLVLNFEQVHFTFLPCLNLPDVWLTVYTRIRHRGLFVSMLSVQYLPKYSGTLTSYHTCPKFYLMLFYCLWVGVGVARWRGETLLYQTIAWCFMF